MFAVWLDCESVREVARACGVSEHTVRRYRARNKWEDRKQRVLELMSGELNEKLAQVKNEMILEMSALRYKAKVGALRKPFKDAGQAYTAYLTTLRQEMELRKEIQPNRLTVLMIAAQRFQKRREMRELPPSEYEVKDPAGGPSSGGTPEEQTTALVKRSEVE